MKKAKQNDLMGGESLQARQTELGAERAAQRQRNVEALRQLWPLMLAGREKLNDGPGILIVITRDDSIETIKFLSLAAFKPLGFNKSVLCISFDRSEYHATYFIPGPLAITPEAVLEQQGIAGADLLRGVKEDFDCDLVPARDE